MHYLPAQNPRRHQCQGGLGCKFLKKHDGNPESQQPDLEVGEGLHIMGMQRPGWPGLAAAFSVVVVANWTLRWF